MDITSRCDYIQNKLTEKEGRVKLQKFFHGIDADHNGTLRYIIRVPQPQILL